MILRGVLRKRKSTSFYRNWRKIKPIKSLKTSNRKAKSLLLLHLRRNLRKAESLKNFKPWLISTLQTLTI
jgi:hypothetical protein